MLPVIKRYEPPKRRLRIKNRSRLTIFLLIILLTILAIFIPERGTSQVEFIEYQVSYGDTYWQIARDLQKQGYRAKDDIRLVVDELIRKSGIPAHKLQEGDIILIPDGFLK